MELKGSLIRDIDRTRVGRVQDVLLSPDTLEARWLQVAVDTDGSIVLVPSAAVSESAPGELLVPYPADVIVGARHPRGQALTEDDARRLLGHYGFSV